MKPIKKLLRLTILVSILVTPAVSAQFAGGSGTEGDPWQVATAVELDSVRRYMDDHFILMNDIDLDGTDYDSTNGGWSKIGNGGFAFTGVFDGNSNTINGVFIDNPSDSYRGFFAYSSGTIKNLTLTDLSVTGFNEVGGLVALNEGLIENVSVTGFISGLARVGGLAGSSEESGVIKNSNTNVTIVSFFLGSRYRDGFNKGGLVGSNKGKILGSNSSGSINEEDGGMNTGGLVGSAIMEDTTFIKNSWSSAVVTGANSVGGLVGYSSDGLISNSYATGNVTGGDKIGGLVGNNATDIDTSYATGSVTGDYETGGLVGQLNYGCIDESYATGNVTSTGARTGGLVGATTDSDITSSWASGTVSGTTETGGLVGRNYYYGLISESKSTGAVSGTDNVGGFIGNNSTGGLVQKSYSLGDVQGEDNVGGFIGSLSSTQTTITDSYSLGAATGTDAIGGFIGKFNTDGNSVTDSYSSGSVTGATNVGGFIGKNSNGSTIITSYWNITESGIDSSDGGTGLTRAEFLDPDSFSGFNFSTIWDSVHSPEASSPYLQGNIQNPAPNYVLSTSGNGSSGNPYQISTYNQLQNIGDSLSSHFILINDIDASESATANSGEGFDPIGSSANPFTGGFNGDGYTISDLTINRPTEDDIGLFGDLHGSVSNLNLLNVNITGDDNVGGLAGLADSGSDVSESSVSGSITGDLDVGGLAGETRGSVQTSYTHAFVTGGSDVGGLIGFASSNSDFSNSYSMGKVTGSDDVGGFIGEFNGDEISTSYSTSKVTGSSGTGGFIGRDRENWNTLQYIYWNLETSGQSNGNDGESAGLTTIQMMISGSFSNFDFTNIWDINEDHGFPYLRDVGAHRTNIMEITGSEGWRVMSSPMEGISYDSLLKDLWTQGFTGADNEGGASNVYTWNEATQSYQSISSASDVPAAGQGFAVYVFDDQDNDETAEGFPKTLMIEGNQMEGTATPTLSYTDTGNSGSDGWNLVGNPYAFPLNWAAGSGWTQTNIDASFYVWNAESGEYQSHNGLTGTLPDALIAPGQGFWVKANAAGPALSLTHDVRGVGGVLLKSTSVPQVKLQLEGGELSSKASVMFSEFAELGKDRYDAFKLAPLTATYLSLGTLLDTLASMDIQALPLEFDLIELELDIKGSDLGGNFSLSWEHLAIPERWEVTLTDRKTNEHIDMSQETVYEFVMDSLASKVRRPEKSLVPTKPIQVLTKRKSEEPRLMISISSVSNVSAEPGTELPTSVELQQNYPNPFNPSTTIAYGVPETGEVTLQVFDILGRKVATLLNGERKSAGRYTINFDASNLASGMYIYRLRAGNTVITKKLTLIK